MKFEFSAKLWEYQGESAWFFLSLPRDLSADIKEIYGPHKTKGFGSIRVKATVGKSTWQTSIFPDSKLGCYLLPVKKPVRQTEKLSVGDNVKVVLELETT